MIKQYKIQNYKAFRECTIELSKFNLFSGPNSVGKSSAIQALLIASDNLSETQDENRKMKAIHLPMFAFYEVRSFITNAKTYQITLVDDEEQSVDLEFSGDDKRWKSFVKQINCPQPKICQQLTKNLYYLPATRLVKLDYSDITNNPDNPLGLNCENVIDFFYSHYEDIVKDELLKSQSHSQTVIGVVNYWLYQIMGYKIKVDQESSVYKVRFIDSNGRELRPYHIGTGVSYIVEILIACLCMDENGLVIIENPEIHLHPSAVANLIDFLALVARSGRQIIVESHSDHIFNGIRRLLHKRIISIEDVSVTNFTKQEDSTVVGTKVELSQEGGIIEYTPGLFDQIDNDLDEILSW